MGPLKITEQVFQQGGKTLRPLCQRLNLQPGGYSRGLEEAVVDFGAEDSFALAAERLSRHHPVKLCANTVRAITLRHAEEIRKIQHAEGCLGALPAKGAERLIAEADGTMLPVVDLAPASAKLPDRRKHARCVGWRCVCARCVARTATHDYTRHGTITLFAALSYLDGKIFHNTAPKHTHPEWLGFLKQIDREAPDGVCLHLIVDNYCTHKHSRVSSWIKWRNQRYRKQHGVDRITQHFTPNSSSWMNLVERFFRDITVECIRDGSFGSVKELTESIVAYLEDRNLNPIPCQWKAEGKVILEKINRARAKLLNADIV